MILKEEKMKKKKKKKKEKDGRVEVRKLEEEGLLREVIVKIGLERIDMQKGIIILDSEVTGLVISSEFAKKKGFKLKKIERSIYMRNMDGMFNRERLIEYTVEVNIYHKRHRERTEIDVIGRQK